MSLSYVLKLTSLYVQVIYEWDCFMTDYKVHLYDDPLWPVSGILTYPIYAVLKKKTVFFFKRVTCVMAHCQRISLAKKFHCVMSINNSRVIGFHLATGEAKAARGFKKNWPKVSVHHTYWSLRIADETKPNWFRSRYKEVLVYISKIRRK